MPAQRELMDEAAIQLWILRYLGAPLVKVELTQAHLDDCIEDAKRWFTAKKGQKRILYFDVSPGVSEYTLPADVEVVLDVAFASVGGQTATQVISAGFGAGFGGVDIFGGLVMGAGGFSIAAYGFTYTAAPGPLSSWVQYLQYLEQFGRIFSSELDWSQEKIGDYVKIRLFPVQGYPSGKLFVEYKSNMFTVSQLSERDHDLLKRFALVVAKERLGRVRSKYPGGYPTAQGTVDLDGATLLDEALTEKEKLEAEIFDSGFPMGFMLG